mgnify:CR=1 FL=1
MQFFDSRQVTTGLVVNKKVNVKREYYETVRAQCNSLFRTGAYFEKVFQGGGVEPTLENGSLSQLEGKINFIYEVKKPKASLRPVLRDKNGRPLSKEWKHEHGLQYERADNRKGNARGVTAIYKKFLAFKHFYANARPKIVCEGKTDIIYLQSAIHNLVDKYPTLATRKSNEIELSVEFYHNHGRTLEVMDMGVGAPFLAKLIEKYSDLVDSFKCVGLDEPVIIVVDNDSGPRGKNGVYAKLKKYGINGADGSARYYYITKNLYLVPLPKDAAGKDIAFEDLFDAGTLSKVHKGKKFNRKNKIDEEKEFGKVVFANQIVKKHRKEIDFSKFEPLLDIFLDVFKDYSDRLI